MIRLNGARHILSDVEVLENVARDIHTQCGRDYGHAVRDASYHLSVGLGWNRYEVAYYLRTALRRLENDEEAEIDAATTNSPDRVREHCDTLAEALRERGEGVEMGKYEGHTPEPWEYRTPATHPGYFGSSAANAWCIVAVSKETPDVEHVCGEDEQEYPNPPSAADAALLTDAPTLLAQRDTLAEALRECASIVQAIGPITRPSFPVSEARRTAAQKQAEDALERLENEGKE